MVYSQNVPTTKLKANVQSIQIILNFSNSVLYIATTMLLCFVYVDVHAQADELLVRWMIEGQSNMDINLESENFINTKDVVVVIEELTDEQKDAQSDDKFIFKYDSFVTGNQYAMGDYKISIFSKEGQILNQAIIDQRQTQAESFRHKIKYNDRFSDGYVELAEALLDPLGTQTYFIKGSTYDHNINSNLDIFVLERGYSLDNLQAVPNYIFSPMEFTLGRDLLADSALTGKGVGDLRIYSPNHRVFDDSDIKSKIIDSLSEQNSDITDRLLLSAPMVEPTAELYTLTTTTTLPLSSPHASTSAEAQLTTVQNLFDDVEFTAPRFEDAGRVRMAVETFDNNDLLSQQPQLSLLPPSLQIPPYAILLYNVTSLHVVVLFLLSIAVGLVAFGYVMWQKTKQRRHVGTLTNLPLLQTTLISSEYQLLNYKTVTRAMISDAQSLYNKGCHKKGYEMLGQAIRLFYSHHLSLQHRGLLTSEELLGHMRRLHVSASSQKSVKKWLAVCGSVEYAKYEPDSDMFAHVLDAFLDDIVNRN